MHILLLQFFSTLAMFGLIWFVQAVHYPLFQRVGLQGFGDYAALHATRTTYVVAPLMLAELVTTVLLLIRANRPAVVHAGEAYAGALLVAVLWLSTGLLQVPLHNRLQTRYQQTDARKLVQTNWIRTAAWSLRAMLVLLWASRLTV